MNLLSILLAPSRGGIHEAPPRGGCFSATRRRSSSPSSLSSSCSSGVKWPLAWPGSSAGPLRLEHPSVAYSPGLFLTGTSVPASHCVPWVLLIVIPIGRIGEDGTGDAFGIGLVADDMFIIIPLPDIGRIQFPASSVRDGGFEGTDNRSCGNIY